MCHIQMGDIIPLGRGKDGAGSFVPSLSVCQAERLSLLSMNGQALEP